MVIPPLIFDLSSLGINAFVSGRAKAKVSSHHARILIIIILQVLIPTC